MNSRPDVHRERRGRTQIARKKHIVIGPINSTLDKSCSSYGLVQGWFFMLSIDSLRQTFISQLHIRRTKVPSIPRNETGPLSTVICIR